eukprot:TRINITY_DN59859_c0_g1_i1.p1 TRINITY_DN59859_c0_g1~~TRINITY_DN59859_c0_g1_i1.p1  ORF type:complete len:374 (+),score=36.96 TRINITY_DN59859_c0_g1_i1:117-1238(+)
MASPTSVLLPVIFTACVQGSWQPAEHSHRSLSVSGQSAGGSMAVQHLFAYSSHVDGAAIAAGSPYGCGVQHLRGIACYYGEFFDLEQAHSYIDSRFAQGLIDDPSNLNSTPVLLFNGQLDFVVRPLCMHNVEHQLQRYSKRDKLFSVFSTHAAHVWSVDTGNCSCGECALTGSSDLCCDVNNCAYDLSGDMLRHIYGHGLNPRVRAKPYFHWVNQWRFLPVPNITAHKAQLLEWAMVYVPKGCESALDGCRVHLNYHGCTPKSWKQRRLWAQSIGLNEYAEANNIVVVYPQAGGNPDIGVGCWNWFAYSESGYHDPNFDTRHGAQLRTVVNMIDNLEWALKEAIVVRNDLPCPPCSEPSMAPKHSTSSMHMLI